MEMTVCSEYRISHTEFLSWDPEDRAKALAYAVEKAETCQMCGTAPWEWANNKHAYTTQDHFCPGCYAKHVANEDRSKLPGTTVELTRMTPLRLAEQQIMDQKRRKQAEADRKKAAEESQGGVAHGR